MSRWCPECIKDRKGETQRRYARSKHGVTKRRKWWVERGNARANAWARARRLAESKEQRAKRLQGAKISNRKRFLKDPDGVRAAQRAWR
jgi:hypothetical protein